MTKICITSSGTDLESPMDPRFGRCAYFIIVDTETMQFECITNDATQAPGGAGIRAAQTVSSTGAKAVITGSVGPNAYPALQNADIRILNGSYAKVRDAIEGYASGQLSELSTPGPAHIGMGGGRGAGRGRGGGGRGRRGW
ncbi:MAG: NifB/NifX family molybdenum-iron cluster-binding protein [Candidatus Hodarchaeota archaeon]